MAPTFDPIPTILVLLFPGYSHLTLFPLFPSGDHRDGSDPSRPMRYEFVDLDARRKEVLFQILKLPFRRLATVFFEFAVPRCLGS